MMPCACAPCGLLGLGEETAGFDWGKFIGEQIGSWSKTGQTILTSESLPRGVYQQTGPGGTITYTQPSGSQQNIFGATGGQVGATASPGMGLVLVGGAALLLVFLLARR